jgi:hypothetical protein
MASPQSHSLEEACSPGVGVQQTPRSDLGNHRRYHPDLLMKLLEEMFQNTRSWPTNEQMRSYHIELERDSVRRHSFNQHCNFLKSYYSHVWMHAFDSFMSPILGFEGDIPIPAIPVS